MPLVVGSCGVCLEVAGRRGCSRRRALVGMHGGRGLLQVQLHREGDWEGRGGEGTGWRARGRVKVDYRCGGNRRVLMVAITSAASVGLGSNCQRCLSEDWSTRGGT